jgi:hypothetical protein
LPRAKVKYKAVGTCPNCGTVFMRPAVCTHAICDCSSIIEVPLKPVLILPSRLHRKIKKITDLAGIPLEDFVNALLLEAMKEVLKGKMTLQYRL